jgi:gas vesicle protein GvpA/GvpJ/GvpM family
MDELTQAHADAGSMLEDNEDEPLILSDLLNRVLDKGVVISGEVMIAVAGVDLVRLDMRLLLVAVERLARKSIEPPG